MWCGEYLGVGPKLLFDFGELSVGVGVKVAVDVIIQVMEFVLDVEVRVITTTSHLIIDLSKLNKTILHLRGYVVHTSVLAS